MKRRGNREVFDGLCLLCGVGFALHCARLLPTRLAALFYVVTNVASFGCMLYDRQQGWSGGYRVSESYLLLLAACGGAVGCLAAVFGLRHKLKKPSFVALTVAMLVVHHATLRLLRGSLWPL